MTEKNFLMSFGGALILFWPGLILSAQEPHPPMIILEGIVVTATRGEVPILDAPGSINVIGADELEKKNVKDVDEAVRLTPGVYARKRKGFADIMPSINIRGLSGTDRNLILIDGQPVMEDVWRRFPLELVERIEVAKGPFSSLYGEGAMGGVVNVITRRPKGKLVLKLKTGIESFNTHNYEMLGSGKLKGWLYSVSARKRRTDGYRSNLTVKSAAAQTVKPVVGTEATGWEETTDKKGSERFILGDAGENYYRDISCNGKLGYEFSPVSGVQMTYTRTNYEYGYKNGKSRLKDSLGSGVDSGDIFFYDGEDKTWKIIRGISETDFESSYGGNTIDLINLSGDTKISGICLKGSFGYDKNDYWWVQPSPTNAYICPSRGEKINGELSASKTIPLKQRLTLGLELKDSKNEGTKYNLSDWKDKNTKTDRTEEQTGKTSIRGVYLQDEISFFEPLIIYLAGRYDRWSASDGYNFIIKNGDSTAYAFGRRDINYFSPKVAVIYKIEEDMRVRFSIGQAFRGPTSYEMYSGWEYISAGQRKTFLPNPDLYPEKVVSGEIGMERLFADKTSIKMAYFHNRMNDYIYSKKYSESEVKKYGWDHYGDSTHYGEIAQKQNIAKAKSEGVELEIRTNFSEGLTAFANATAMATKVLKNPAVKTSEGKKLTNIPETTYNLGLEYCRRGLEAGVVGRYTGKTYSEDDNSDVASGVYGGSDPFLVVDAKISYRLEFAGFTPEVSFTVDNIFAEEYYQYYKSPGRIWGIHMGITRKF
ncbi:TonB-dependent receptor [candidate division TA06 bacterium]|uniref:TonB-dependent receptor n=1 Tax=candidate division TA06 bacterium TaxID=2250710 RepID=A0A933MJD6_UNCT6|nr:TonB-dependent receptor [candidate division TA06 bacterium]